MSRSYKHTPRCGDKKDRDMKKLANRKLRHNPTDYFLHHNSYKKNFCSWDICDYETVAYTFEMHWQDCLDSWHRQILYHPDISYPNKEKEYRRWYRWYKSK